MKSMTGYGRGESQSPTRRYTVEMKSVNHRYAEVSVRLPREWLFFEDKIKKMVLAECKRGRVDVFVTLEAEALPPKTLRVDWSLIDAYLDAGKELEARYTLTDPLGIKELLKLPDVVQMSEEAADLENETAYLAEAVEAAAEKLTFMRAEEGKRLYVDISERLQRIEATRTGLLERAPEVAADMKQRLYHRIKDWLPDGLEPDEGRLLTEVAIQVDRSDISEELTRLGSHLEQFSETIEQNEPIGRSLDFLLQEMNREVNTIGSKSSDIPIARSVVLLKSELEKIREQIQNIE
jgi:uncharacterized protein (TIGR00255 family)